MDKVPPAFDTLRALGHLPVRAGQGQGGNKTKASRSVQILAACSGLWIGLVLVLASSLGWQIALPVLVLGAGGALVFASFLPFKS